MFALVKWIGGQDDKKYTPDVPVSWIKAFNIEEFKSDTFDPSLSYVIEWHSTKKIPPGGWPVHDGYVIAVSRSIVTLRNKLKALDGLLSPKCKTSEIEHSMSNQTGIGNNDEKNKSSKRKTRMTQPIDSDSNEESSKIVDGGENTGKSENSNTWIPKLTASLDKEKRAEDRRNMQSNDSDSDSLNGQFTDVSGCSRIKKNKRTSTQLYKDNSEHAQEGSVARALNALRKEIKLMRNKRSDSSNSSTSDEDEKKEIGRRGSGIFISNAKWEAARAAKSYTAMGISLMISLFPMKVLTSNLRGGRRKIPGSKERPNRRALNQKIIDALYYTVQKKWKNSFNKSGLGVALNSKLTQLRSSENKNQVAQGPTE